jgi:hypothetical protein
MRFASRFLACLFSLVCSVGCKTTDSPDASSAPATAGTTLPPLTVIYHPYGPSLDRSLTVPRPDFTGLTDRRIDVDGRQMREVGISGVLIRVDAASLKDAHRRGRIHDLTHALASGKRPLRTTIQVVTAGVAGPRLVTFLEELRAKSLHALPGYRRLGGEPLIEYLGTLPADYKAVPGLAFRPAPTPGETSRDDISYNPTAQVSFMLVCRKSGDNWEPNRHPRPFTRRLKKAAGNRPREIRLDAWNNFANGAFIQPSVDHGRDLLDALGEQQ